MHQLASLVIAQLLQLQSAWHALFMDQAQAVSGEGLAGEGGEHAEPMPTERKEELLSEALVGSVTALVEVVRRRLEDEEVAPADMLAALQQLVTALTPLHDAAPHAKLLQRVTRAAESLAKRAIDQLAGGLQSKLAAVVAKLIAPAAADSDAGVRPTESPQQMQSELRAAAAAVTDAVRAALADAAPLIVPLCELLAIRADEMARHLVASLHAALKDMAHVVVAPSKEPRGVLLSAGLCMFMSSAGVAQVPALLKEQLAPHGLGGAALGFDHTSLISGMSRAADALLSRFVEIHALSLSRVVSDAVRGTDWIACPTPRAVTELVGALSAQLRRMQSSASEIFPSETARSLLPQGPFPAPSGVMQLLQQRARDPASSSNSIHKELQRMFARKISLEAKASGDGKPSLGSMLTHVVKLTLKTLLEEVRMATFGRCGFQQMQVDCCMLRWMLPSAVHDDGSALALLDEVLISCQERCLSCMPLDQAVIESLCESERQRLLLSFA